MNNLPISNTERQQKIVQIVESELRISIPELCERFSISEATARRDLETLAEMGKIERVHGGAIPVKDTPPEQPILQREIEESSLKHKIGLTAAELIHDGETVFLGSGTTVLEVARSLKEKHLTIITNSLPVVNLFAGNENIEVICMGGMLRSSELSFIGHITEQALTEFRADKVIIGTRAISLEHGLTHDYLPETQTDRAIIRIGKEVIVVADHTKFGRAATVLLAPLTSIHTLITDSTADPDFIRGIQEIGIKVLVA